MESKTTKKNHSVRITSQSFDFQIPAKYFPALRVVRPFYARVSYEYNHTTKLINLKGICLDPVLMAIATFNNNMLIDIEYAARNNANSFLEEPEIEVSAEADEVYETYKQSIRNY